MCLKKYFVDILFGGYDVKYERFVLWSELYKKNDIDFYLVCM